MSITNEQYQKIMRFLDAGMDPEEMDAFEKELSANAEMRSQLNFEQSLRDSFGSRNIKNLADIKFEKENTEISKTRGKLTGMRKWWTIGAAVVTVLLLFAIFWQKKTKIKEVADVTVADTLQKPITPPVSTINVPVQDSSDRIDLQDLFKQYFRKDALPEQYPLFLAEALMDYESGNYKTLQKLNLNDLPQTRSIGEADSKENILQLGHYYKGLAFLQTNNNRDAIENLHWVIRNQHDKTLRAKAQWYLALAYLKENNSEKAAALCRSIVNNKDSSILVKNAKQILDALKK